MSGVLCSSKCMNVIWTVLLSWSSASLYRWCTVVSGRWNMMNPRLKMSHEGSARVWHVQPSVIIFYCRLTNYELLRWLVETPSRDSAHYRLSGGRRIFTTCQELTSWHVDTCHEVSSWHLTDDELPCVICFVVWPTTTRMRNAPTRDRLPSKNEHSG